MLKLKKALALLIVCAMALTLMVVPAMAEESLAPTKLFYEDFNYGLSAQTPISSVSKALAADETKGFTAGWTRNDGNAIGSSDWAILNGSDSIPSLKAIKYSSATIKRPIAENKQISFDGGNLVYYIGWEQYFDENVTLSSAGSSIILRSSTDSSATITAGIAPSGDKNLLKLTVGTNSKTGKTEFEFPSGGTYQCILRIESQNKNAGSTIGNDRIKLKIYPKGTAMPGGWGGISDDAVVNADTTTSVMVANQAITGKFDTLSIQSSSATTGTSNDIRFSNIWVEYFDSADKVTAINEAEAAVAAFSAATQENADELYDAAELAVNKLGDSSSAEILRENMAAIIEEKDLVIHYDATELQRDDFKNSPVGIENDVSSLLGDSWEINADKEGNNYIKTVKHNADTITRNVKGGSEIDLSKEGIYYVTFEQYLSEKTYQSTGAFITLDDSTTSGEDIKFGMRYNNSATTPATRLDTYVGGTQQWSDKTRLVNFGKVNEVVLKIVSHSDSADEFYYMVYPKGSAPADWDNWNYTRTASLSSKIDTLKISSGTDSSAGNECDTCFADYSVDFFAEGEAVTEFNNTETALKAIADKLANGEAADSEIEAAEAQIAKLSTDCNTKTQWNEIVSVYKSYNEIANEVNSYSIADQEAYNALQKKVCLLPGNISDILGTFETDSGKMKAALQAKLDTVAVDKGFIQYIWNATYTEGAGTINKNSVVTAKIANGSDDMMIIAAYNADGTLVSAKICTGEEISYNVGTASSVKVLSWNDSSLVPNINAILYVK